MPAPNMDRLPVDDALGDLAEAVARGNLVVRASPGAGKTTRVPPALLSVVRGRVLVLEPRRVAARSAATRVAAERGGVVGDDVGWQVRFDRRVGPRTRLVYATEGTLLRQLLADPLLDGVGAVVLDEVHERSVDLDLALALLREAQRDVRPDLRLVAMSATVDARPFADWLDAPVLDVPGRNFPVDLRYDAHEQTGSVPDRVAAAVRQAWTGRDAVLAFLPGAAEIRQAAALLADLPVLPLTGSLAPEVQDAALRGGPRVVLATNVAETSVTVEGVSTVIDAGWARRLIADPATGMDRLETARVSRASADQRAGRAGRLGPGRCTRLWTERVHRSLAPAEVPEIHRVDLSGPTLALLNWGADPIRFDWFDRPPTASIQAAMDLLAALGLRDDAGLTPSGRLVATWPVHPRLGCLLLEASARGAPVAGAWAAALLGGRDAGRTGPAHHDSPSDLLDRVEDARRGRHTADQQREADALARLVRGRPGQADDSPVALGRAVLAAWPDRLARRRGPGSPRGVLAQGRGVRLAPSSAVRSAPLFVCLDVDDSGTEALVRIASGVDPSWLHTTTAVELDFDGDRVIARRRTRTGGLLIDEVAVEADPSAATVRLAQEARRAMDRVVPTEGAWPDLVRRARFVAGLAPDEATPEAHPEAVLDGLCVGRRSFSELRAADWAGAWRAHVGFAATRRLDVLAPDFVQLPNGRAARIDWSGERPVLAARMQHLFGLGDTPRIAEGRVPLLLHLLAPNGRPQQITDDLAGFWDRTWPSVRKELRGRYPRHAWPEDPRNASPPVRPRSEPTR